jgi:epoxyqueuosine reductase
VAVDACALKAYASELGFDLAGVCAPVPAPHLAEYRSWLDKGYHGTMDYLLAQVPLKQEPSRLLPGVQSVIAVVLNYYQPLELVDGEPRIARYALGRDYHKVIRSKLRRLSAWIAEQYPDSQSRACVDSAPIFERDYAHLAGLGWFGKNTMLINSHRGSWFFIGLLLTTVEFERDKPAIGGCGTCRRCVEACPTGAIVFEEDRWQVDARRCISYLTIEHEGQIDYDTAGWTFGCDVCQEVCPFNEVRASQPLRSRVTTEPDFLARRSWPSLIQLRQIEEPEWDELTQGSPVRRTGIEGLRRNAELNLQAISAST